MTNVCVGGTFDNFHYAHKMLLKKSVEACGPRGFLYIGITTDDFASKNRKKVQPFETRVKNVESYLRDELNFYRYSITNLHNKVGLAPTLKSLDTIVVSDETCPIASKINRLRLKKNLKKLAVINIGTVLAADFQPISATRVRDNEIDTMGRLKKPLKIGVGSTNQVKLAAVKSVFAKIYGSANLLVKGVKLQHLPQQPFGLATIKYAIKRAKIAMNTLNADLGVGIEAGLFYNLRQYFDVQYCAIIDRNGTITVGHGSGFVHPPEIIRCVKNGKSVGEAFARLYGIKNIGRKEGAIGFLSKGLLTRKELTEQAVLMAFIPRLQWIQHALSKNTDCCKTVS